MICKWSRFSNAPVGLALVALAALLVAVPARAQSVSDAKSDYDFGTELYRAGRYLDAVQAFEAAYAQRPKAMLLYNIGQALRKAGRFAEALAYYKRFLVDATPVERRPVEAEAHRVVAEIEEHLRSERTLRERQQLERADQAEANAIPGRAAPVIRETKPPPPSTTTTATTTTPPALSTESQVATAPHRRTPVYKRWWVWTIVGVGAVGLAVGLGVGLSQHQPSTDLGIHNGVFP